MAERVGFEPTEPVKVQQFSRLPDSTALAPLRKLTSSLTANITEFQVGFASVLLSFGVFLFRRKKSCIKFLHSCAKIPDLISIR